MDDTICAPATPPVHSPIAIIRISGPDSLRVASSIFTAKKQTRTFIPRYAYYGFVHDDSEEIDDCIVIYYNQPHSYTGEDMVEIFCHGNPIIVNKIIDCIIAKNVRMAQPGEFTKRAFLNGKMDLTEAEAINHIIAARSEWEIATAIQQRHGSLKHAIDEIKQHIIELKADIECAIDFVDEDIEIISYDTAQERVKLIISKIDDILNRCRIGQHLSHGIDIALVGKPNAGKSSFLNCLLNHERAIVSDTPGTTRDVIRESVSIKGIQCNLLDTAGIHQHAGGIELLGVQRSHKLIEEASLIIFITDAVAGFTSDDEYILQLIGNRPFIPVINKADIASQESIALIQKSFEQKGVVFSAKTGYGIPELEEAVYNFISSRYVEYKNSFIADIRIMQLLEQSVAYAKEALKQLETHSPYEIVASALQNVIEAIGAVTGEITVDDVLNSIFSRFCIGK
ncbi:MAG: tRNA uridine-5-carboxymethylaminomethyl(34) synthesis GTPase MnmE [Spirochaetes bacterium]|nr:tRNA uridine-5-carboxymethylaminomethyl(34) synthesis GTPase MnmE [Spirochaetota bacterium]